VSRRRTPRHAEGWYGNCYSEGTMIETNKIRKIIRILIGSRFYFDLSLQERYDLIRYILRKFPFSV
jgi:hypothetical protein